MIFRRLAGYLRHDNWFTVILELVIVVVGLFLAFQLDRWYETQRSKSSLQAHLVSLAEDFMENEAQLQKMHFCKTNAQLQKNSSTAKFYVGIVQRRMFVRK